MSVENGSNGSSRHVEVRLGKSFLKFFGGEQVAAQFPDAPSYSAFYYHFKPARLDDTCTGELTEKNNGKFHLNYTSSNGTQCLFSGKSRPGSEMECLLVYDEAEQCYMLEKLDMAYEDLRIKDGLSQNGQSRSEPEGDIILPTIVAPPAQPGPSSSAGVTSPEDSASAPAKKRQRKPRAKSSTAASPAATAPGEAPAKKPRKKRMTKKEREALAQAQAQAQSQDDDETEFMRELERSESNEDDSQMQYDSQPIAATTATTVSTVTATERRPQALPPVMSMFGNMNVSPAVTQQQQPVAMNTYTPPDDIQQNEEDKDVLYHVESPSSSDQSSDSSNSDSDDSSDSDDD